ncbi:MAG: Trk system potassium transporter TrkA [Bacteroidetes bacterium]|nr:Trk system potassium transporter TrkA [Bacteroidota bacterium]
MRIILAGAGEVGKYLAKMLSDEKHDIIIIDPDSESLNNVGAHLDLLTLQGSSTSFKTLKEAEVDKSDLFIAVAHSEETNIIAAMLAKRLGSKKTIARIDSHEYLKDENKIHFKTLGIDNIVYPQRLAAKEIVKLLHQSGTSEIFNFSKGKLSLFAIKLSKDAPIVNKTLFEAVKIDKNLSYRAVAITRDGKTIIPRGDDILLENDIVYVITKKESIKKLKIYSGIKNLHVKNIMILGGSRIGIRSAKSLQNSNNVKLIEIDRAKAFELADSLTNTLVINGDCRDNDFLCEEDLGKMDALIAVTGNPELNMLSCLLARKAGVKKTIAAVENIDYIDIAEKMGIDAIINKKLIAASYISRFTINANVTSVVRLTSANAEVLEFVVRENAKITKDIIKNINFPKDAILGGLVRDKLSFICKGDTLVQADDKVVVFSLPSAINKVKDFFN